MNLVIVSIVGVPLATTGPVDVLVPLRLWTGTNLEAAEEMNTRRLATETTAAASTRLRLI